MRRAKSDSPPPLPYAYPTQTRLQSMFQDGGQTIEICNICKALLSHREKALDICIIIIIILFLFFIFYFLTR